MVIKRVIGFIAILGFMMVGVGSNIGAMLNGPAAIIVFGLIISGILAGGRNTDNLFSIIFNKDATSDALQDAAQTYRDMQTYAVGSGLVGTFIGVVIMLKNMSDLAAFGPAMAVALLTILYSLILKYFVFGPIGRRLEDRAAGA